MITIEKINHPKFINPHDINNIIQLKCRLL